MKQDRKESMFREDPGFSSGQLGYEDRTSTSDLNWGSRNGPDLPLHSRDSDRNHDLTHIYSGRLSTPLVSVLMGRICRP